MVLHWGKAVSFPQNWHCGHAWTLDSWRRYTAQEQRCHIASIMRGPLTVDVTFVWQLSLSCNTLSNYCFQHPTKQVFEEEILKPRQEEWPCHFFKLLTAITEFFVPSYQLHSRSRWLCPTHGHTLKSLRFFGWVAPLLETLLQLYSFETTVLHREWWCWGGS